MDAIINKVSLGELQPAVDRAVSELVTGGVLRRIFGRDHTVWKPDPQDISNRLGWLKAADMSLAHLDQMTVWATELADRGLTKVLLMGMGGSSLAPEVLSRIFGTAPGRLALTGLDSTDPGVIIAAAAKHDPASTLHLVCSKSGSTVEPLSMFKFFWNRALDRLGKDQAGANFAAITDPGSGLAETAKSLGFGRTWLNDPDIGGRYSALSLFGMVPAALIGADVKAILNSGRVAVQDSQSIQPPNDPLCLVLGAAMAEAAKAGRDKLTLVMSPQIEPFGDWVEQLIAESTGKEGTGILPVVGEEVGRPGDYGSDRLFVHLKLAGDDTHRAALAELEAAGHPGIELTMDRPVNIGGQFFFWEMATAIAGARLGINPFDQPNVESAKVLARQAVDDYQSGGGLPVDKAAVIDGDLSIYGPVKGADSAQALADFLAGPQPGAYIALQAYLRPGSIIDRTLAELRLRLRSATGLAVTVGYGPRFLHSTGQLHKGDAGRGLFIQFTADDGQDAAIPDRPGSPQSSISFGVLKMAQALGDGRALAEGGRRVMRIHLGSDASAGLDRVLAAAESLS